MSKVQGNLSEGPILKVLIRLALPIMLSAFLGTAYNITDMAWIGMLGSKAVAGVGVGGMYVWLAGGLAALSKMGGQVYVAQCLGKGEREEAKEYAKAAVYMALILGVVFGFLSVLFTRQLVSFFRLEAGEAVLAAHVYLRIACGFVLFSFMSTVLTGLYTAQGDSKTPLMANFMGLVLNMVLDPLLILGIGPFPRLEAAGAAIATVLAQAVVAGVMIVRIWSRKAEDNLLREVTFYRLPHWMYVKRVFKMGGPTALQSMLYCMFSMILSRMVSAFGDGAVATQRVGGQIESISWNTADGFASAMNAFAAQNYGAGKMERVKKGYKASAVVVFLWGMLVALLFLLFPRQISSVFFHEADVVALSVDYLRIIGAGEAFMCLELMAVGAISGMGNTKLCSVITILFTGMRVPLAFLLSQTPLKLNGIWWALTISSVIKGLVLHGAFYRECRRVQ